MAYDEALAERIHQALARKKKIEEKKMFGGVGFVLNGNLLVGVWKDSLCVRLGPDEGDEALKEPHVKEFDIIGRPMKGWVLVESEGVKDDDQLKNWIQQAMKFVGKLSKENPMNKNPTSLAGKRGSVIVRVSTTKQDTDSQINALRSFLDRRRQRALRVGGHP